MTTFTIVCSITLAFFAQFLIVGADKVSSPGTTLGAGFTWLACLCLIESGGWSNWTWAAGTAICIASIAVGVILRKISARAEEQNRNVL